uniref:Capsid protein n=1 Tax=Cruciviridae sp. TaxID=1955495 RepID=A0A1S6LVH6_9VIRU|nr:capsid protein [Cruciviridae sp.]
MPSYKFNPLIAAKMKKMFPKKKKAVKKNYIYRTKRSKIYDNIPVENVPALIPSKREALINAMESGGKYVGKFLPYGESYMPYVGKFLGGGISAIAGHGDYKIKHNTLLPSGDAPPQFGTGINAREVRVRHREYITDIFSSTGFNITGFSINPGLLATFPWLSNVAENFECYRLNGMVFHFKSMSSDVIASNTTNNTLGQVIMSTQYNAFNPPFVNKLQMEQYEFTNSSKPSCDFYHYIECARSANPLSELYIRTATLPTGQDPQFYDIGQFFIATNGMQASNINLGELWVTYDITLMKQKLIAGEIGDEILYFHQAAALPATVTTSKYFGSSNGVITPASNLPLILNNTTITFPSYITGGNYLLQYFVAGTGGSPVTPNIALTSGCAPLNIFYNDTQNFTFGTTSTTLSVSVAFTITSGNAIITFSSGTIPTGQTGEDLLVTQINGLAN